MTHAIRSAGAALLLGAVTPAFAHAHEGHGFAMRFDGVLHYLLEPMHLGVFLVAAVMAVTSAMIARAAMSGARAPMSGRRHQR